MLYTSTGKTRALYVKAGFNDSWKMAQKDNIMAELVHVAIIQARAEYYELTKCVDKASALINEAAKKRRTVNYAR